MVNIRMTPSDIHESKVDIVNRFFAGTGRTYDFMVTIATFGIDRLWKRRIIDLIPLNPSRILDLACGTGILTLAIARRYPNCQVIGVELRDEYLTLAREKVLRLGLTNVEFILSRAEDYHSHMSFDAIVSSYLAKYADLSTLTINAKRMLKERGLLLMHDFTYPPASLVWLWRMYFWMLQHVGTPLFPTWREIYYGLPKLIEETRWASDLPPLLEVHGFRNIRREDLTAYGSAILTATK